MGPVTAQQISLCTVGGACAPVWSARDEVAEYGLRAPKFLEFKAEDGTTLYGRLLLPPDTPASSKIPLIVNIYGGPAAQMVLKEPTNPFDEILARKGFAIFSVDNRGTPGRDRKFQTAIRHEFGAIELKDQLAVAGSAFRGVSATRSRPRGDLGMVEWRLDDALCDDPLGALSRGSCRGSCHQPDQLRYHLYRALYGPA